MKSGNKVVYGKFDCNKTPLVPLGTKKLVYASWAPHRTNAYYIGPALKYYWCLQFYMPGTRQYWVANTWQLYSMHCTTPTLSPADVTILQAMGTLTALGGTVPTSTSASIAHTQAIQLSPADVIILKADVTILQAMDTLSALGGTVPTSTSASIAHTQAIQ
jgi:hypothetical protein